ncbi:GFA family protein [Inquilinus sp. CA228]|uniref:GFA family protein n=1 Tax=Inquilinus sp. CA228 TaxID=3455609 RepID=UPI003F8D8B9F
MADQTGGCLCGAVRYRVTGPLRPVVACHCSQCRRTSGHVAAFTADKGGYDAITDDLPHWPQSPSQLPAGR